MRIKQRKLFKQKRCDKIADRFRLNKIYHQLKSTRNSYCNITTYDIIFIYI